MLRDLLNSFSGQTSNVNYPNGYYSGTNGVGITPSGSFKSILGGLLPFGGGAGNGIPMNGGIGGFGGFGAGIPFGGFNGISPQAINAFNGAQGQINTKRKARAFTPGAVLVNTQGGNELLEAPAIRQQTSNQLAALNPLQGFVGGQGNIQGNAFNPQFAQPNQFAYMQNQGGLLNGGIGALQILLLPIAGLFSFFKSLFGLKNSLVGMHPVQVDRNDLNYYSYQDYLNNSLAPGDFAEPDEYEGRGFYEGNDQHSLEHNFSY